jgi:hypothetical protein
MAIHGGRLFCGTLPSGHVFSMEAGRCISMDEELDPGWQHIAAIRESDKIILMINGRPVARGELGDETLDVSNSEPLKIGFGEHDYFRGSMRDVRIYARALTEDEVKTIRDDGGGPAHD